MEFITLTFVSCVIVVLVARFSLKSRTPNPLSRIVNVLVLTVLVIIGMLTGKYGATWGLPWWLYYPVPMLLTVVTPVIYFKMGKRESFRYIILTIFSAPAIHIFFSLFGWNNYMPFIEIPSLHELFK